MPVPFQETTSAFLTLSSRSHFQCGSPPSLFSQSLPTLCCPMTHSVSQSLIHGLMQSTAYYFIKHVKNVSLHFLKICVCVGGDEHILCVCLGALHVWTSEGNLPILSYHHFRSWAPKSGHGACWPVLLRAELSH